MKTGSTAKVAVDLTSTIEAQEAGIAGEGSMIAILKGRDTPETISCITLREGEEAFIRGRGLILRRDMREMRGVNSEEAMEITIEAEEGSEEEARSLEEIENSIKVVDLAQQTTIKTESSNTEISESRSLTSERSGTGETTESSEYNITERNNSTRERDIRDLI